MSKTIIFTDRSVDSVRNFLNFIARTNPLTTEEECQLWQRMQQGDKAARQELILSNLRYGISVAKKYCGGKAPFEDLIMAACEGIVIAADKFDGSHGVRFISYATFYIENEVRKCAYGYIKHANVSLDESVDIDEFTCPRAAAIADKGCCRSDWNIRYRDAFIQLQKAADRRLYGAAALVRDFYDMLQQGYTSMDFARRHHLNNEQMHRFLTILSEEAIHPLHSAA